MFCRDVLRIQNAPVLQGNKNIAKVSRAFHFII